MQILIFLFTLQCFAADTLGPNQGILLKQKNSRLELLAVGKDVMFFPYDLNDKPIPLESAKLVVKAKGKTIRTHHMDDHFHGRLDSRAQAMAIEARLTHDGKEESFRFQLPAKK